MNLSMKRQRGEEMPLELLDPYREGTIDMSIRRFGLSAEHAILTSGCTFNPTLQSSTKMTLGPMTIALNLAQQKPLRIPDFGESRKKILGCLSG